MKLQELTSENADKDKKIQEYEIEIKRVNEENSKKDEEI